MTVKINERVSWVGKIDWELRHFHGEELSTHRGSSYNSYLIRDEKNVLIDTVWGPFAKEFVSNLAKEINLSEIDYIICTHGETDHSGALQELLRAIPNTPVYCTANAVKSLTGQYHENWNFQVVKTGDRLNIGTRELIFIEAPMLHWPDSMFCYLTDDHILFSNDGFGQHYASEYLFNDLVDQSHLYEEALKYYANILAPFNKIVLKKIDELKELQLPLKMICPSHGIIWRNQPEQIIAAYEKWAQDYQENQITIVYDTMWNGTRKVAEAISKGIQMVDPEITIKLFNSARSDKSDILTELYKSKAVLVGSPTVNRGILSSIAGLLDEVKRLGFKGKKGAAFGTYGWSGESVKVLTNHLTDAGFQVLNDGLKVTWSPGAEETDNAIVFGKDFVTNL